MKGDPDFRARYSAPVIYGLILCIAFPRGDAAVLTGPSTRIRGSRPGSSRPLTGLLGGLAIPGSGSTGPEEVIDTFKRAGCGPFAQGHGGCSVSLRWDVRRSAIGRLRPLALAVATGFHHLMMTTPEARPPP